MRKLLLRSFQSPGDIAMLTAAIRDLDACNHGVFLTSVDSSCPALWENNPFVAPAFGSEEAYEMIDCEYPLIHRSNTGPWHFIHAYHDFLSDRLGVRVQPTEFRGDIHLSAEEKGWISQVEEITGEHVPFWIIAAGGKFDFTAKWWPSDRYQAVVDHFRGKILFVRVGEVGHHHPAMSGTLDLRGKTDLRQFIRLM